MKILAGVDEVGRGSLIGPVYAAAIILNNSIDKKLLKDSKTLTKDKREELEKYIKKNSIWAIGQASTKEIEKINILQASLLAMKRAILKLKTKPSLAPPQKAGGEPAGGVTWLLQASFKKIKVRSSCVATGTECMFLCACPHVPLVT